jgi:hypothetical protein
MFGFIILRHVNSPKTNLYWNHSVQCIQRHYPYTKIVIIDDNSNPIFLKSECNTSEITIVNSEFKGRGEILPYYYLLKYKWFDNTVIIHDSVFINKRIHFEALSGKPVVPLWSFEANNYHIPTVKRLATNLSNNNRILNLLSNTGIPSIQKKWRGCFGAMCFINTDYLLSINTKYNLANLVHHIKCRDDRCALERILGIIFASDISAFGDIFKYGIWGLTYDQYINQTVVKPVIKVFTGR